MHGDAELAHLRRAFTQHVAGAMDQGFAERPMGNNQDSNHGIYSGIT